MTCSIATKQSCKRHCCPFTLTAEGHCQFLQMEPREEVLTHPLLINKLTLTSIKESYSTKGVKVRMANFRKNFFTQFLNLAIFEKKKYCNNKVYGRVRVWTSPV